MSCGKQSQKELIFKRNCHVMAATAANSCFLYHAQQFSKKGTYINK